MSNISFYVLKFVNIIYQKSFKKALIKISNIFDGELLWLRDIQYSNIIYDSRFDQWKKLLNLFTDNQGVIRSRSRLLDTEKFEFYQFYYLHLIILQNLWYYIATNDKVCHEGVESTLTKFRLKYWIIKGRQTVRKIIKPCVTCKKVQGKVLRPPHTSVMCRIVYVQNFHFKSPVLTSLVLYLWRTYILKVLMLINVLFWYLRVQQVDLLI